MGMKDWLYECVQIMWDLEKHTQSLTCTGRCCNVSAHRQVRSYCALESFFQHHLEAEEVKI